MASISISGWGGSGGRTYTLTVTESSYSVENNTSVVSWTLTSSGGGGYWYDYYLYASVNGTVVHNSSGGANGSFPSNTGSKSGTLTVSHNSDGKKSIGFYIEGYAYTYSTYSNSGTLTLTNIDRVAPTVTAGSPTSITINSMSVTATANVTCSQFAYRYKTTADYNAWTYWTGDAASHTFDITGLANNTTYTIQVAGKKKTNGLWGYSDAVSEKTLGASTITSAANVTLGNNCNIVWRPLNSTFRFRLKFSLGSWSYTTNIISPATLNNYTFSGYVIPLTVANQIPNATVGTMTATLTTYTSANEQVGASSSKTFTVAVPSSIVPTISSVTLAEGTASGFGVYAKSLSTVKSTTVASGSYRSTISSIVMTVGGKSYTASSGVATSGILQTSGTLAVKVVATDSRGRTATNTQNITVYDYFVPTATLNIDVNGTTVVTTVAGSIASVNNLNAKKLVITRKRISDDTITTYTVDPLSAYNYSVAWTQTVSDVDTETYLYTVVVTDTKQSVTVEQQTAVICLSRLRGGTGVTLFREATESGFWIRDIKHDITSAEYLELANLLANAYSVTADYFVGEFCIYNSYVWECTTAISGGEAWNASHWTQLGVAT